MATKKEIKAMSNGELLRAYRRACENLIFEANTRRGETKTSLKNTERLEAELKGRLEIPPDYAIEWGTWQ